MRCVDASGDTRVVRYLAFFPVDDKVAVRNGLAVGPNYRLPIRSVASHTVVVLARGFPFQDREVSRGLLAELAFIQVVLPRTDERVGRENQAGGVKRNQ